MSSRPQSATSTPKRQLSVKERSQRSGQNIFGDHQNTPAHAAGTTSSGRRSPSNASVVSIPLRRSTTPHDYSDRAHSEKSGNQKDHRCVFTEINMYILMDLIYLRENLYVRVGV